MGSVSQNATVVLAGFRASLPNHQKSASTEANLGILRWARHGIPSLSEQAREYANEAPPVGRKELTVVKLSCPISGAYSNIEFDALFIDPALINLNHAA